jgi:valyl-tRNA synthetase
LVQDVDRLFESHQYSEAGRQIYDFFWFEFADWYLEIAKLQMVEDQPTSWRTAHNMMLVFDACLRMLHPFMPYVTEELWGHLKHACSHREKGLEPKSGWEEALIVASWPKALDLGFDQGQAIREFAPVMDLVRAIRNIRTEKQVKPKQKIGSSVSAGSSKGTLEASRDIISSFAGIDPSRLIIEENLDEKPKSSIPIVVEGIEVYLPLADLVDTEDEIVRLNCQLTEVQEQIDRLEELLSGPFAERAPKDVVDKERKKLVKYKETADKLKAQLQAFSD